jgi:hypothetical protein
VDVVIFPWICHGFSHENLRFSWGVAGIPMTTSMFSPRFPRCLSIDDGIGQDPGVAAQDLGLAKIVSASQKGRFSKIRGQSWENDRNIFYKYGDFFLLGKIIVNGG